MPNIDQRRFNHQHLDFIGARDAARELDVKPATLYAYVSRGLVRSIAAPKGRARLYSVTDLRRLRTRRDARRGHAAVAAAALDWGAPVLDSAITRIDQAGPHYRGHSAIDLAATGTAFEQVAELLWGGAAAWRIDRSAARVHASTTKLAAPSMPRLARFAAYTAARGLLDADRHAKDPVLERERAARLIYGLAASLAPVSAAVRGRSVAELVCRACGVRPGASELAAVDSMLILCADHELNISTFAVRVVASGRADLYACLTAGLSALSGAAHGGMGDRLELMAQQLPKKPAKSATESFVRARLAANDPIPGFGHPLYPAGDPRAAALMERARELAPRAPRVQTLFGLTTAMRVIARTEPNLDMGLCAASAAVDLPPGAASAIFALGRIAGWVAHVFEQRESPVLLRPRARYVGPAADAE